MSALPPEADIRQLIEHVCFVPETDIGWVDGQLIAADGAPRKCCNVANATEFMMSSHATAFRREPNVTYYNIVSDNQSGS
jgi:hypothetical protein